LVVQIESNAMARPWGKSVAYASSCVSDVAGGIGSSRIIASGESDPGAGDDVPAGGDAAGTVVAAGGCGSGDRAMGVAALAQAAIPTMTGAMAMPRRVRDGTRIRTMVFLPRWIVVHEPATWSDRLEPAESTFAARIAKRSWAVDRSRVMAVQDLQLERVVARGADEPAEAGFAAFFDAEHERLLRALYLVTGDRSEADDIAQEAFVKILERWDTVRLMDSPTGYLYRTAMNSFRSGYRRSVMAIRRLALVPLGRRNPFEDVEIAADVRRALTSLTPRQRAAIVLTELLGYPSEDAGSLLGIQPSTVRALTTQARARMKAEMGGDRG
jgi:RNA polymerase sigma factor (sigma-70 family)